MMIALNDLTDGPTLRRVKVPEAADAALTESIRAHGVLAPILVRPVHTGMITGEDAPIPVRGNRPRYEVVIGTRRWRCAVAAGLTEIPAEIRDMTDAQARLAQLSETAGEKLHDVDIWRAVRQLMDDDGVSAAQAATAMGLPERKVRLFDQIARLPASLLALCEIELPPHFALKTILRASKRSQHQVGGLKDVIRQENDRSYWVDWETIARKCEGPPRLYRADAIFDVEASGIAWTEDWLEPEGSAHQWSTDDIDRFMRLQREALEARCAGKKRWRIVDADPVGFPKLPKGMRHAWGGKADKLHRHQWALWCIADSTGAVRSLTAWDVATEKEAERKKDQKARPTDADDAAADADTSDDTDDDTRVPTPEEPTGLTHAGMALLHQAKTEALRETLREDDIDPHDLLVFFVLALCAENVSAGLPRYELEEWAANLVDPVGRMTDLNEAAIRGVARQVLASILSIGVNTSNYNRPHSGWPAEIIGRALDAQRRLPRFDTELFLAEARRPILESCAEAAGVAWKGSAKAMRGRLQGQAEHWQPTAAQFGAPGPRGSA